ncbi:Nitroreductase-like protein [Xylariales sp. PMI_506]|nr:Nitroreductase-like protein [Xylariales sp. PMI_506]
MGSITTPSISADKFLEAAAYRRSVYALKDTSKVSDERIKEIITKIQAFAPSSYNTQPTRVNLVTGEKQKEFWELISKEAEPILKSFGAWEVMGPMLERHKSSYGSVVFWEDGAVIKQSQETHKGAAHMFPQFSDHANGMFQGFVWSALELEGLGANLQHMQALGPAVEGTIKKFVGVPETYNLKANMNFGDEAAPHPEIPAKIPIEEFLSYVH